MIVGISRKYNVYIWNICRLFGTGFERMKKCPSLAPPRARGTFYKLQQARLDVEIIWFFFHQQESWDIFVENSIEKNFNPKFVKKEDRAAFEAKKSAFNILTSAILVYFNLTNLNLLCSLQSWGPSSCKRFCKVEQRWRKVCKSGGRGAMSNTRSLYWWVYLQFWG